MAEQTLNRVRSSIELPELICALRHLDIGLQVPEKIAFPFQELPPELLVAIIQFSLPTIDPTKLAWNQRDPSAYMAALYTLRCVSTLWRDTIDGTPLLWTLVSSGWSREAIVTTLSRSGICPLIIQSSPGKYPVRLYDTRFTQAFFRLVEPHRHRWAAAILALPLRTSELPEFLNAPLSQLGILKLSEVDELGTVPCTPGFIELLGQLRHVHLNRLPLQWQVALGAFKSLKTLMLTVLEGHGITTEQIVQAISNNPSLSSLTMIWVETDDQSVPVGEGLRSLPNPVIPPRLSNLQIEGRIGLLYGILSRIELPPSLVRLVIVASPSIWDSQTESSLLTKTLEPLFPTIQRIHAGSNISAIVMKKPGYEFTWVAEGSDGNFKFGIARLASFRVLKCFTSLANRLHRTETLPCLSFVTDCTLVNDHRTLSVLATIQTLNSVEVCGGWHSLRPSGFLAVLSGSRDPDTEDDRPVSFPLLQNLKFHEWRLGVNEIIEAMERRYSHSLPVDFRPRHKLRIDLGTSPAAWYPRRIRPKVIPRMEKIEELRSIDGIESVRLACLREQPGMLAAVWSEEKSAAVWG
ncbi:hypothetical protein FRC04_006019 [Tulasnella sp. 424]|nr:hypothetical protein FRC04_006019 [Tulasnella sp. 424]